MQKLNQGYFTQMRIFQRLQLVCKAKNLKLKDFVAVTGLPYRTGQSYLSGTREPNPEGMQIICIHLGVNLNWLLTGNGSMFIEDIAKENVNTSPENTLLYHFRKTSEVGKKTILATAQIMAEELHDE